MSVILVNEPLEVFTVVQRKKNTLQIATGNLFSFPCNKPKIVIRIFAYCVLRN